MIKVGEHITIDFLGVKKDYLPEFYEKVIYKIAKAAKVEILNVASHKFEPQGFTLVALLSESHFSFHTFPEKGVISFDFFTCGKVNPKVALKILRNEIDHKRVVTNAFDRSSIGLYDDIYSTQGQKKFYVVKDVLEKFTSKVGQFVEIMDLEEFGHALFIDHEIQVAEKDEKIYSSNFFKSSYDLSKKNNNVAIIGGGDGGTGASTPLAEFTVLGFLAMAIVPSVVNTGVHGFANHHDILVFADRGGLLEPFDDRVVHGFQRNVWNFVPTDNGHHGDFQGFCHRTGRFDFFHELGVVAVFGLGVADGTLPGPASKTGELGDLHSGFIAGSTQILNFLFAGSPPEFNKFEAELGHFPDAIRTGAFAKPPHLNVDGEGGVFCLTWLGGIEFPRFGMDCGKAKSSTCGQKSTAIKIRHTWQSIREASLGLCFCL